MSPRPKNSPAPEEPISDRSPVPNPKHDPRRIRAVDPEMGAEELRRGYWILHDDGSWERTDKYRYLMRDRWGNWVESPASPPPPKHFKKEKS